MSDSNNQANIGQNEQPVQLYILEDPGPNEIDARPTKELFIEMLTKDIDLIDTVNDLVDNSIDGAKRLRSNGSFDDLYVHITANEDVFEIVDNCGGIEADVARHYAFRFGRPKESKPDEKSVGLFGVGMKRAFFKLGLLFQVESNAENSSFLLRVDVKSWKDNPHHWGFPFSEDKPRIGRLGGARGTKIIVEELNPNVKEDFGSPLFIKDLGLALKRAQQTAISRGLTIRLNETHLIAEAPTLLDSSDVHPVYINENVEYAGKPPVHKKIYIGLGKSSPTQAGWYIYCNGRLVVEADKSIVTGWGGKSSQAAIPEYHNQFAQFRGYVFLDSNDPTLLPYNTTKSGIDAESPMFKSLRGEMIDSARPIFDFLNELKLEKENQTAVTPLENAIDRAHEVALEALNESASFVRPSADLGPPAKKRISFTKPSDLVDAAMEHMQVTTPKAAGERMFDYYYEAECSD